MVVRYVGDNPNGSYRGIAGIANERGNVVGLMPHPEHATEELTGPSTDGLGFFTSVLSTLLHDHGSIRRDDLMGAGVIDTVKNAEATPEVEQP